MKEVHNMTAQEMRAEKKRIERRLKPLRWSLINFVLGFFPFVTAVCGVIYNYKIEKISELVGIEIARAKIIPICLYMVISLFFFFMSYRSHKKDEINKKSDPRPKGYASPGYSWRFLDKTNLDFINRELGG